MNVNGKKVYFLGDSITAGAIASKPEHAYVNVFSVLTGAIIKNYGVGGTRIARQTVASKDASFDQDFIMRLDSMDDDADLVVVFGGTNDFGHGDAKMGTSSDDSPYTFYGACKTLYNGLKNKYPDAKLVVVLPLNSVICEPVLIKHGREVSINDYRKIINEVAVDFGFYVLDLTDLEQLNPTIEQSNKDYFVDGLHPNDKGHEIIAQKLAEFIINI